MADNLPNLPVPEPDVYPVDHVGDQGIHVGSYPDPEFWRMEIEGDEDAPRITVVMSVSLLVAVVVFITITVEYLVDSINGVTTGGGISKVFIGMILLPIVGNTAKHTSAVGMSAKDRLVWGLDIVVGSSLHIALVVIPFIVILAWTLGKPLSLLFDPLESIVLVLAVLPVNYVMQKGKSNWLEGIILIYMYLIFGVTFWFYPGTPVLPSMVCT